MVNKDAYVCESLKETELRASSLLVRHLVSSWLIASVGEPAISSVTSSPLLASVSLDTSCRDAEDCQSGQNPSNGVENISRA
jgi:hypothetical protein